MKKPLKYFIKFYLAVASMLTLASLFWLISLLSKLNLYPEEVCESKIRQSFYTQYEDAVGECLKGLWKENTEIGIAGAALVFIFLCGLGMFWLGRKLKNRINKFM